MYYTRNLEKNIVKYLDSQEIQETLLISGARQTGKSSLIQNLSKNYPCLFINLYESITLVERIDQCTSFSDFEKLLLLEYNFKPGQGTLLVIDEAQESKMLGRWIRFFKEKWGGQKVILLGSILSQLFTEENNYPVGRVIEYTLRPFNFQEFLNATQRSAQVEILQSYSLSSGLDDVSFQSLQNSYLDYLQIGGMPNIVIQCHAHLQNPHELIEQLLRQYSLDITRYLGENYRSLFLSAMKRMSELTCQPVKNSKIVSTDSPFYRKLPKLLEILEQWHLLFRIPLMNKNPESRGGHASKKYCFDIGMISFFLNKNQKFKWQDRSEMENTLYGKLQENFIFNELVSLSPYPETGISFFKETKNSQEVDFIFTHKKGKLPIEVKSQSSINRNNLKPMLRFLELNQSDQGVLIYNGVPTTIEYKGKSILAIPPFLISEIEKLL